MTKTENEVLKQLLAAMTDIQQKLDSLQSPPKLPAQEADSTTLIVHSLQQLATYNKEQMISQRLLELMPPGSWYVGDPWKLREWVRRQVEAELEESNRPVLVIQQR